MRVVIAEDLGAAARGLAAPARRLAASRSSAAVDDGAELIAAVEEPRPDIAVVDVRLPPTFTDEGIRAAIEARRRVPGTPILILSQYVEERYAAELLADDGGGVGYLLKDRVADVRRLRRRSCAASRPAAPRWTPKWSPQLLGRRATATPLRRARRRASARCSR